MKNAKAGIQMHIEATEEPIFLTPGAKKAVSTKSWYLPTIETSVNLWIERIWALVRFVRPKSSLGIIFELIIVRKKPIELQTRCLVSLRGIKPKKTSYELKTLGFSLNCSAHWRMPIFQALATQPSYCYSIECSSLARTSYLNYINSGIRFKPNWVIKTHTELALVLCV